MSIYIVGNTNLGRTLLSMPILVLFLLASTLGFTASFPQKALADNQLLASLSGLQAPGKQNQRYTEEVLKYAPSLPSVPTYTGKGAIMTSALYYPDLPTGKCYNLKYQAKEDAHTAHEWYQMALKQMGWQLDNNGSNALSVTAHKEPGMCCYVYTRASAVPGYRCEIILRLSINPS